MVLSKEEPRGGASARGVAEGRGFGLRRRALASEEEQVGLSPLIRPASLFFFLPLRFAPSVAAGRGFAADSTR